MTAEPLPQVGERARLRRLRPGDLAAFQAYRGDPEVGRWQGWQPMTDADAAAFLAANAAAPFCAPGAWLQLAIADTADTLVGDVGLHPSEDGVQVELGISLAAAAQGRGLATEAVALVVAALRAGTGAQRLVASTDLRNTACLALLPRCGMAEVRRRRAVFRGEPCIEVDFAMALRPGGAGA